MMIFFTVGLLNFEEFLCLIINYFDFFPSDRPTLIEVLRISAIRTLMLVSRVLLDNFLGALTFFGSSEWTLVSVLQVNAIYHSACILRNNNFVPCVRRKLGNLLPFLFCSCIVILLRDQLEVRCFGPPS